MAPRGRARHTIKFLSNKRQKSYSPSLSSASSSVVSPRKKRRTSVCSEDVLDDSVAHSPSDVECHEFEPLSPSATEIAPGSYSEEEVVEMDATFDSTSPGLVVYKSPRDELTENDDLQIIGETDPTELSSDSEEDESSDVPVRLLTDFTIYNMETRQLVPVGELLRIQYGCSTVYGASGTVEPYVEDEQDEEDEVEIVDEEDVDDSLLQDGKDDQIVKLSDIVEFDIHHVSSRGKKLDSKMYLRTKYAWYILDTPAAIYTAFFADFWLQHRILHLVVTAAIANGRITFDEFIASLKVTPETSDAISISIKMLGRELTQDDVESDDVKSYLLVTLDELRDQEGIRIERVPLIKTLRRQLGFYAEDSFSTLTSKSPRKKFTRPPKSGNPEAEVLKHRNATVVTPLVSSIAAMLFERTLRVAGQLEQNSVEDDATDDVDDFMHRDDPDFIEWLEPAEVEGYYESVDMDGVTYSVGDAVMVMPGNDVDRQRSANAMAKTSRSKNTLGNTMWFCRICFMYEADDGEKVFHGQWYTHGSKTLLQETANPQSLFLLDSCEPDLPLASIIQKCNIRELALGEDEPTDETNANENKFYHGLTWIQHDSSLVQLSQADIDDALAHCDGGMQCLSCGLKEAKDKQAAFGPIAPVGFKQRGHKYHIDDYVYIIPSNSFSILYRIGRITKVKAMRNPPQVYARLYGRFDDVVQKMRKGGPLSSSLKTDERRLFESSNIIKVDADRIDGKCYVQYSTDADSIDEWVRHDDHYFVNQKGDSVSTASTEDLELLTSEDFKSCLACHENRLEQLENSSKLLERHGPLRGLELYSGAGGLGTGLDQSGFVETRWAIEFSPSAALTYQANHRETVVFNQCSNLLLQHAIDTRDGKKPEPLRSLRDGKTALPPMPRPGDVDFVYGGPPCQSFSGANHYKKANDVRSTLVCNMLSYVEFYRPSYFLLENVVGLLQFPLMGRMVGRSFAEGIKMGVVKFIVRSLTCLGYQVRFKVLQAGQYGAPQGRKRVLFWGAKRGLPLPEFPVPTHGFSQKSFYHSLPTGEKLPPPSRSLDPDNLHQYAALHPVTINDAIGDLPPFDWINPHVICKPPSNDKAETKSRDRHGIPEADALIGSIRSSTVYPGFTKPEPYAYKPLSRYQKAMRTHVASNRVSYQYTKRFSADIVERVASVPLRPNAFHDDLPVRLHMNRRKYEGLYGRLDGNGHFKTAMTTVQPNSKGGVLLHPWQKRIVTIRECARAQGFPDNYEFLSVNKDLPKIIQDQHRQIGNAVPVPLALALGKALGEVLLKTWQEEERAGSPEV